MNEVLMIYLWGIYDNIHILLVISIIGIFMYSVVAWIPSVDITTSSETREYFIQMYRVPLMVLLFLVIIVTAMPSKNVMVLMFSAPKIIDLSKEVKDSKSAEQIVNILSNSLNYLEQESNKLTRTNNGNK